MAPPPTRRAGSDPDVIRSRWWVLVDLAACRLVGGHTVLDGIKRGGFLANPGFERMLGRREFADPPPGPVGGKIEVLQLDEVLKIWVHQRDC